MKALILVLAVVLVGCGTTSVHTRSVHTRFFVQHFFDQRKKDHQIIEAAIRKNIKKPFGKLTKADLAKVKELYITVHPRRLFSLRTTIDHPISDLTPLAGLKGLKGLYLFRNKITDLTPLAGLKMLGGGKFMP